jgi:Cu2+-exporting ATPase
MPSVAMLIYVKSADIYNTAWRKRDNNCAKLCQPDSDHHTGSQTPTSVMNPTEQAVDKPSADIQGQPQTCYHCGLPVPPGIDLYVEIQGEARPMCCHGCEAVAQAIIAAGHGDFYKYRTDNAPTGRELVPDFIAQTRVYDHPEVQKSFVRQEDGAVREAALILEGITCAACIWLNERHLAQQPGVLDVQINYATHRARIRWDDGRVKLSDILQAVRSIGYEAHPYDPQQQQQAYERERRTQLQRLGVAGVMGMQVMMLSAALYVGDWSGMEQGIRSFFRWIGLLLTTPVLLYSAQSFFRGAWRDLLNRRIGMDVPVSLGILVAFAGSVHATLTGLGEVYYDSVVMFVFFLLVSRYFELMARKRGAETAESLGQALPVMATRLAADGEHSQVPVAELDVGDRVLVRPGETIPADGRVETGHTSVNEALLTGESTPRHKAAGDVVVGGSINIESPLTVVITTVGMDTVLASIMRLLERAQGEKPDITRLADRAASWFVSAVVLLAGFVALYWWQQAPESWLPIVVSVLVVTCPCALSLATPTAISAVTGTLQGMGLLSARGNRLETLAQCSHVVFDKTGTLTQGRLSVGSLQRLTDLPEAELLAIAAALERQSEHPIAAAILAAAPEADARQAHDVRNEPGAGMRGTVDGRTWWIGRPDYVAQHCRNADALLEDEASPGAPGARVALADAETVHALLVLHDSLRPDAADAVRALQASGRQVILMTGDNAAAAHAVAGTTGITEVHAGLTPQDKLERVQALQQQGALVAMVGDGINDAPVLAAADVSIAMHDAAHVSHASADMILLTEQLMTLADGMTLARKAMRIIRQNLAWAVSYNLIALPAAALGYVAPWMAAIGMSASSLLVVVNALRLTRRRHAPDKVASSRPATVAAG